MTINLLRQHFCKRIRGVADKLLIPILDKPLFKPSHVQVSTSLDVSAEVSPLTSAKQIPTTIVLRSSILKLNELLVSSNKEKITQHIIYDDELLMKMCELMNTRKRK